MLSDHARLLKLLLYLLGSDYTVVGCLLQGESTETLADSGPIDLVILAQGELDSEPLIMLSEVGLGYLLGQVPVLLITERRIPSAPHNRIYSLAHPFTPDQFRSVVRDLAKRQA